MAAGEVALAIREQSLENVDVLLETLDSLGGGVERNARLVAVGAHPPRTESQLEPAAAERVATSFARTAGCRKSWLSTAVAIRMCDVAAAIASSPSDARKAMLLCGLRRLDERGWGCTRGDEPESDGSLGVASHSAEVFADSHQ